MLLHSFFRFASVVMGFVAGLSELSAARQWYVSGTGQDSYDGRSEATAFRTLQKAADQVEPGDTVIIGDGSYTDDSTESDSAVLTIARSGRPDAWITWKAAPGARPEIKPVVGWAGIVVIGSYHLIEDLTVLGANDSITLLDALADAKNPKPTPRFNTNGIFINGRRRGPEEKPHHIIIRRCTVGKMPGGGITAIEADYVTIEDCVIFDNAWYMRYGGSGITTLNNWRFDDAPGYHIVIQRNLVWNNKTMVPWERIGKLSDGNGILLDVTDTQRSGGATNPNADAPVAVNPTGDTAATAPAATPTPTPAKPPRPEWKGRALIANNVSAFNGGSGIHTFRTKHVDIVNNTTYWNGQTVGYQELFPNRSEDVVILNNIIVPRPGGRITSNNRNTDIRWDYNLYPEKQDVFAGPNDIVADPAFVRIKRDLLEADFRLKSGSRGRDSGTDELAPPTDVMGRLRPQGAGRDRGAYEQ